MARGQGGGRPTKKPKDAAKRAEVYAAAGFTISEIADLFGVCRDTIHDWMNTDSKFSDSLLNGRAKTVAKIFGSTAKAAQGFTIDSEEIKVVADGRGDGSHVERVKVKKYYPPDTRAAIFLLTNLKPDKFKNKIDTTVTPPSDPSEDELDLSLLSDEEIEQLARLEAKAKKQKK